MHFYVAEKDGHILSTLQSIYPSPYQYAKEVSKEEYINAGGIVQDIKDPESDAKDLIFDGIDSV